MPTEDEMLRRLAGAQKKQQAQQASAPWMGAITPGIGAAGGAAFQPVAPTTQAPQGTPFLQQEGQREQFFDPTLFEAPWAGEQAAQGFIQQGAPQAGLQNVAMQNYQQFQNQIGTDPGLGAYYDRAKGRLSADMNQQLAARGGYRGTVGAGMVGDALGGLEAQRAKEEADYMLNQQALGAQSAAQASQAMLGWTTGLGALGLGADASARGRLGLGMQGATAADAGLLDRGSLMSDIAYKNASLAMSGIGGAQSHAIESDWRAFEAGIAAKLGRGTEAYNQALQKKERDLAATSASQETVGKVISTVAGGT